MSSVGDLQLKGKIVKMSEFCYRYASTLTYGSESWTESDADYRNGVFDKSGR